MRATLTQQWWIHVCIYLAFPVGVNVNHLDDGGITPHHGMSLLALLQPTYPKSVNENSRCVCVAMLVKDTMIETITFQEIHDYACAIEHNPRFKEVINRLI